MRASTSRGGAGLQEQAQRHLEVADQAALAAVGQQPLVQFFARQRLAGERVDHHLAAAACAA